MIFSANFLYKKIYANPNLYFDSNPSVFFLIPQYTFNEIQICTSAIPIFLLISFIHQKRSKSVLQLSPIFFLSNSSYTFNENQICTSANPIIFSANFLYKKIYANPNLYFDSNPSFFCLIPFFIIENPNLYFG